MSPAALRLSRRAGAGLVLAVTIGAVGIDAPRMRLRGGIEPRLETSPEASVVLADGLLGSGKVPFQQAGPRDQAFVFSTVIGGSLGEYDTVMTVDDAGNIYLVGSTSSYDFPLVNEVQSEFGGGRTDMFVAMLTSSGDRVLFSSYLGGPGDDRGHALFVDASGMMYVAGQTNDPGFLGVQRPSNGDVLDAFVVRIDPQVGSVTLVGIVGGSGTERPHGVTRLATGETVLVGYTTSLDFPLVSPIQDAYRGRPHGRLLDGVVRGWDRVPEYLYRRAGSR